MHRDKRNKKNILRKIAIEGGFIIVSLLYGIIIMIFIGITLVHLDPPWIERIPDIIFLIGIVPSALGIYIALKLFTRNMPQLRC